MEIPKTELFVQALNIIKNNMNQGIVSRNLDSQNSPPNFTSSFIAKPSTLANNNKIWELYLGRS